MLSEDEITQGLVELASTFGRTVGDERWRKTVFVYRRACRRLSLDQWTQAVGQSLEQDQRFPTPRQLIEYSGVSRATRESRCEFCGLNPATFRELCAECALDDRDRSMLRPAQPQHERIEEGLDAVVSLVRRRPKADSERPSWYIHQLAVASGLVEKQAGLFADVPRHGQPAPRTREPGEDDE